MLIMKSIKMLLTSPYQPISIITLIILAMVSEQQLVSINSSQQSISLMSDGQYHFIPVGSFFQYSLASWQEGPQSKYINTISVSYSIQILSPNPQYNFIVLYSDSNNDTIYQQLNCYIRAINQGLQTLMQNCNFVLNIIPNGICNQSIQASASGLFTNPTTFFNCTDLQFDYTIKTNQPGTIGPTNGTFLFIIDNSGLFANADTVNASQIKFILSQQVITDVNEQQKAKLYLFCGLTGILIIIMIIVSIVLVLKIRKVDRELTSEDRNKAE